MKIICMTLSSRHGILSIFNVFSKGKKMNRMLPSGFEPESKPREGFMIGRYTTGASTFSYPT